MIELQKLGIPKRRLLGDLGSQSEQSKIGTKMGVALGVNDGASEGVSSIPTLPLSFHDGNKDVAM